MCCYMDLQRLKDERQYLIVDIWDTGHLRGRLVYRGSPAAVARQS